MKLVASIRSLNSLVLNLKMNSYVKDNEKGGKTAKGIKKNVIKNNIRIKEPY